MAGVVIVPATVLLLGFSQHEAQGTSLVAIVLTAIAGTVVNLRNRRVRLKDGLVIGLVGVVGSVVGAQIALGVEGRTLSLVFGILVMILALRTLYRGVPGDPQPVTQSLIAVLDGLLSRFGSSAGIITARPTTSRSDRPEPCSRVDEHIDHLLRCLRDQKQQPETVKIESCYE